jgi:hypothetical protein
MKPFWENNLQFGHFLVNFDMMSVVKKERMKSIPEVADPLTTKWEIYGP